MDALLLACTTLVLASARGARRAVLTLDASLSARSCPPARPLRFPLHPNLREMALPVAEHLKIPAKNVFANTMSWQQDDNGEPIRLQVRCLPPPTHTGCLATPACACLRLSLLTGWVCGSVGSQGSSSSWF